MEEIYAGLGGKGLKLDEVVRGGISPLAISRNQQPTTLEFGSAVHMDHFKKRQKFMADASFRQNKSEGNRQTSAAGSSSGAKFEFLGKTSYSLGGSSTTVKMKKASKSSTTARGKRDKTRTINSESEPMQESTGNAKGKRSREGRNGKPKFAGRAAFSQDDMVSIDSGDDSSDELNLTSSSQQIESPIKRSVACPDVPGTDSDDCEWRRNIRSETTCIQTSSSSVLKAKKKSLKSRPRCDEDSHSDRTPEKKKPKIKPRPAYGTSSKKTGVFSNTSGSSKQSGGGRSLSETGNDQTPTFKERRDRDCVQNASPYQPIRVLLAEKGETEETPRPKKHFKDRSVRRPAPFPMTKAEAPARTHTSTRGSRKSRLAPFPLSKDADESKVTDQDDVDVRRMNLEDADSDENGSDDDPLTMNHNDQIIVRGGLAPFPMSSQDRPDAIRKATTGSSRGDISSTGGSETDNERSPVNCEKGLHEHDTPDITEYSFTQLEDRPDPKTLCPYCDMPFPSNPSPLLLDMLKRIPKYTDPRPTNPLGLKAPLLSYVSMCQRHQFEMQLLPTAQAAGWPTYIDFAALPKRIGALYKRLAGVLHDKGTSALWHELKEDINRQGARKVMGITNQFNSFDKSQPGYYGEQGAVIISHTINQLFPAQKIDASRIAPLTPPEFTRCVLVPECAVALIQEDLGHGASVEYAIRVMRESSKYGTAMFPDLDNRDAMSIEKGGGGGQQVGEAIIHERVRVRRTEIDEEERTEERTARSEKRKKTVLEGSQTTARYNWSNEEDVVREARGTQKRAQKKPSKHGKQKGADVLEVSDSTDASKTSRRRKTRDAKSEDKLDGSAATKRSEDPSKVPSLKVTVTTIKPRLKSTGRSRANTTDILSYSEQLNSYTDDTTPRAPIRTRIRQEPYESDSGIVLPEEDNRYEELRRSKAATSKLKLSSSLQPLQAAKARKSRKEVVFRRTMWENDDESDADESCGLSTPSYTDTTREKLTTSLTRKVSNSWLWSDPSTPSATP